jgi:hypothetical protein
VGLDSSKTGIVASNPTRGINNNDSIGQWYYFHPVMRNENQRKIKLVILGLKELCLFKLMNSLTAI